MAAAAPDRMAWLASFSIVQRLTALAVVISLCALVVNAVLFASVIGPLLDDLNEAIAAELTATRLVIQRTPPAERLQQARALSQVGMRVAPDPRTGARTFGSAADEDDVFLSRLHRLLGEGMTLSFATVDGATEKPHLIAGFEVDGEPWLIELHEPRGSFTGPLWSLLFGLVTLALVCLLAMMAGIQLIARPLARLAAAVADRRDRLRPLDMSLAAGTELHQVVRSFNGLVAALEAADESRRHMLAGVSHDLRTPLARLRLRAEIECTEATAAALAGDCDAMDRIIGQFLAYAQGEAGVSLGVREPLAELVRHVAGFYEEQGVRVEMNDTAAAAPAYPDLAIQRLLTNLIDNALSHGKHPVRVVVQVGQTHCRVAVHDAGPGIAAAEMAAAVQPFVRLAASQEHTAAALGHCGLGLAIVGQICRELGGELVHQPFDGHSSAVGVLLPLAPQARVAYRAHIEAA